MKPKGWSERILTLPPYLFAEIDRIKGELRRKGVDIIDLSIGDPDLLTPGIIIERLIQEAKNPNHHRYPSYAGSERFRAAVAAWYEDRFGVTLDPETEVLALIGSKEGIAHAPLAFINPGDVALIPEIAYPVYSAATAFAGGKPIFLPVNQENHFRPDLTKVPPSGLKNAKVLFLNFPNNPTAAIADLPYFEKVVAFAKKHHIWVLHDAAYTEVCFGDFEPASFLQAKGAEEVGLEFHSLSKTFNMTGWRVGFAVGNKDAIAGLGKVKTNIDSGIFTPIQEAGIVALQNWKGLRDANNRIYEHRRDRMAEGLRKIGIRFALPRATFYIWCEVPTKESSVRFCARILQETGVSLTPGTGFGKAGEGYFRISLTSSEVRLQEALSKLRNMRM